MHKQLHLSVTYHLPTQAALVHTCPSFLTVMQGIDRRERLRRLAMETIDLAKDPYYMRNHLGQVSWVIGPPFSRPLFTPS